MAQGFIRSKELDILKCYFKNTAIAAQGANVYVGLFTTSPTESGVGQVEVTDANYVSTGRKPIASADWTEALGTDGTSNDNASKVSNANVVDFPAAAANYADTVKSVGFFTAVSGGTPFMWGTLASVRTVTSGDFVRFVVGGIAIFQD